MDGDAPRTLGPMPTSESATFHLDKIKAIPRAEGEAAAAGTSRSESQLGDFKILREALIKLSVDQWLEIPFSGDARAARSRLTSAVKYTQKMNEGLRFGVRKHKERDVFMVHRVAES